MDKSFESQTEEIDLVKLLLPLWNAKVLIVCWTISFSLLAVFYSLGLSNTYKSTIKLIPKNQEADGGLSSLASQYGGIASLAGIKLGNVGGRSVEYAVELMKSWPYWDRFIKENDLKPIFGAVTGWSEENNSLYFDSELYSEAEKYWKPNKSYFADKEESSEPTSFEIYEKIMNNHFIINFDTELEVLTISVIHYSPNVAFDLTRKLANDINEVFRENDKSDAISSIEYLSKKIESTSNTDMLEVFYGLLEQHSQTLMLAEVNQEYLLKTLVKPMVAQEKDGPSRFIIVVLVAMFSFFVISFVVLFRDSLSRTETL